MLNTFAALLPFPLYGGKGSGDGGLQRKFLMTYSHLLLRLCGE